MLPFAIRMKCSTVDWTKVTLDPSKLFLKHQMVESGIKFADLCGGGGDIHGFLSSTQHHLVAKGEKSVNVTDIQNLVNKYENNNVKQKLPLLVQL